MYTGGARVGRIIAKAAAEYLTPVCLELGGKRYMLQSNTFDVTLHIDPLQSTIQPSSK